jgi:hypothetical protein
MWLTRDNGDVVCSCGAIPIGTKVKRSMFGGNTSLDFKDHALISNGTMARNSKINPIRVVIDFFDELSNGDDRDALSLAHLQELWEA